MAKKKSTTPPRKRRRQRNTYSKGEYRSTQLYPDAHEALSDAAARAGFPLIQFHSALVKTAIKNKMPVVMPVGRVDATVEWAKNPLPEYEDE